MVIGAFIINVLDKTLGLVFYVLSFSIVSTIYLIESRSNTKLLTKMHEESLKEIDALHDETMQKLEDQILIHSNKWTTKKCQKKTMKL